MMRAKSTWLATLFVLLSTANSALAGAGEKTDADTLVKLPAKFSSMTPAGSGRYLIFHLKEAGRIAVLDLVAGKIAHQIENVPDGVLIAGGATKFFLVMPGQMMIQRWSLKQFRRERVAPLMLKATPEQTLMGVAADGPLFIASQNEAVLIDPETLKPAAIKGKCLGVRGRYGYALRVSADGQIFGGIPTGYGAVAYTRMTVGDHETHLENFGSTSHAVRWAQPTADGRLLSLPGGAFYGHDLKPLAAKQVEGTTVFPTADPRYFLAVRFAAEKDGGYTTHAMICTTAEREVAYTIIGLKEMAPHGNTNSRSSIERDLRTSGVPRYFYLPTENLLANVHYDNQRVFIRKFDLRKALESRGNDYLFVESLPPVSVAPGEKLVYQIQTQSKKKGVRFKLESGPKGMKVQKSGRVEWKVPPDFGEQAVQVIISLRNKGGEERFHSFQLNINHPTKVVIDKPK